MLLPKTTTVNENEPELIRRGNAISFDVFRQNSDPVKFQRFVARATILVDAERKCTF